MIVTRFPPSPTGYLHIGGARTALYSWLHARQQQGKFVLRIEDTDRERSTEESVQAILDGMEWLGLDYDEGPYYQTQRFGRYADVVEQLLKTGNAYHCDCSRERLEQMREQQKAAGQKPKYDGHCRARNLPDAEDTVVRFKNPVDGAVVIEDQVKGNITISNGELDDLVIARSDATPTYNLTVVVDDMDMGITHVIRGDDHINNTPRQINILTALGAPLPVYAHVPMILGSDGGRMSKRHGAVSVMAYRDQGILPQALLGYLVRLGWSHGDQEIFSIEQMLDLFRIEDVSRSAAAFSVDKLLWVNQEFIRAMSAQELLQASHWHLQQAGLTPEPEYAAAVIELVRERCKTLVDLIDNLQPFVSEIEAYDEAQMNKHLRPLSIQLLTDLIGRLELLDDWQPEPIHACLQAVLAEHEAGFAKLAQPVRLAVTGSTNSPSIDQTLAVLGRDRSLARLQAALPVFVSVVETRPAS